MTTRLIPAICFGLLLLSGCGGTHAVRETPATSGSTPPVTVPEQDGPPAVEEIPPEIANVPDAVPQAEERSPYGNPQSYVVYGKRYEILPDATGFRERGFASWYGKKFHGKRTSSGERYDMFAMTAAHKTLPIPVYARITNISNGKSVVVKINDRGPFHDGRIVDLSYAAAAKLDVLTHGSTLVDLEVLSPGAPISEVLVAKLPTAAAVPAVTSAHRYLQAGVFGDARNANILRDRLDASGVRPLLMKSESRDKRWIYRVLIGPFADALELDAMRTRMSARQTPTVPVID